MSYFIRPAGEETVLYLHGMGSSKLDFLSAAECAELREKTLVALGFPGCGNTNYHDDVPLGTDDLADIVAQFADAVGLRPFNLIGHSLGGLAGLLLAKKCPERVKSFTNIEGNLMPEDCFITRRVVQHSFADLVRSSFLEKLRAEYAQSPYVGVRIYSDRFRKQVSERAAFDYSTSIVRYSDQSDLFSWFVNLSSPRLFVHGSANRSLSYIPRLRAENVPVLEIPNSHHWVLYDNPHFFYRAFAQFLHKDGR